MLSVISSASDYVAYVYYLGFVAATSVLLFSGKAFFTMLFLKPEKPLHRFKYFLMIESSASFLIGGIYTILNYRWVFHEFKEQVPTTEDFMWTILELAYMVLLLFNNWLIVYVGTYDENKTKDDRY